MRANAVRIGGELAETTIARIDALHLPMSSGGMSTDDPLYLEMSAVAWSEQGKAAALDAVGKGLPAMAGVDPLLQSAMGPRYGREFQGTMNAGYIVGEVMRHLGYEKTGEAPCPPSCVAKTAATWRLKRKLS